jgi:general secretion pathway protein G
MKRPKWLNRGTFLGLVVGVLAGVLATATWSKVRDRREGERPASEDATAAMILDYEKKKAHRGCVSLGTAIEAYSQSAQNPNRDGPEETRLPSQLRELVSPPFGGPAFLRCGGCDLRNPWGKPYEIERLTPPKNDAHILIKTTAPDGTLITQFGIGPDAIPK